jgi:hypothetical protein
MGLFVALESLEYFEQSIQHSPTEDMANFSPTNSVNLMPPPPPPQRQTGGPSASELKKAFDEVASSGDYEKSKKQYERLRQGLASKAVSGDDDEKAEILAEAQRKLAAMMHTLPPPSSMPMPLPIRITANDASKADPNAMPDNLKATMSNADPEKNPPLEPWNYWKNAQWNSTFNMDQVSGVEAGKKLMRTALIDPYLAPNLFPETLATRGIMLYGVPGK